MILNNSWPSFQYSLTLNIYHKRLKIRPWRRIENRTQAFESYQFEWHSVTYNPDLKVTIIQRQVKNGKTYSYIYNGRPIEISESYIERRHFQWPGTATNPSFKVTTFFHAECLRNDTLYTQLQWNTNRNLHMP